MRTYSTYHAKDTDLSKKLIRNRSYVYCFDSDGYPSALEDQDFKDSYFFNEHFVLFEVGFNPLTLLCANFDDVRKACRRYHALTNVIEFSKFRLDKALSKEGLTRLKKCIAHRKQVLALADIIDREGFKDMMTCKKF